MDRPLLDRTMIIDIQFNQGAANWSRMREAVVAAEEAGFGTLWNLDHFSGAMLGSDSMSECFVSLGAWAACTSTIGLGTLVVNATNRSAAMLAHCAATVQQVSGGRYTLGIGAGASPRSRWADEQRAIGVVPRESLGERHRHVADTVAEVRRILSPDRDVSLAGFPVLAEPLRVVVGANSKALAEYAGTNCDGINVGHWNTDRAGIIAAALARAGGRPFDASVWDTFTPALCDADHPGIVAHRSIGATRVILTVAGAPDPEAIASCSRYLR